MNLAAPPYYSSILDFATDYSVKVEHDPASLRTPRTEKEACTYTPEDQNKYIIIEATGSIVSV